MLDLSVHPLTIGRDANDIAVWFAPVFERGRAAVFVDTGFLRAILFEEDQYSVEARAHFNAYADGNIYTTNLVLAETVRQITKDRASDFPSRARRFGACSELVLGSARIWVCAPPRDVLFEAYEVLAEARAARSDLDLTDCLSLSVLQYARHRRVFGFDDHFRVFGAALEPRG
jgi:predicted nucleic acid-binding protein